MTIREKMLGRKSSDAEIGTGIDNPPKRSLEAEFKARH
jgi:hypothetical protein